MSRSPFVHSIVELRHERAEPVPVEVIEPVDWQLEMSRVLPEPALRASVELARVSGGVLVSGSAVATVGHTCQRCLDDWNEIVEVPLAHLYTFGDDDDSDYVIDGPELDLEPMLRDEVLLALPLVPNDHEGCAGVVDGPESDLNTSTPDDPGDSFSPFAVLKDLLDAGE
jgi:uncharacterized protein